MASTRKTEKSLSSTYLLEPIAVENLGAFSSSTLNVLSDLGRRINDNSGDASETTYLFQRISVAIQRFNSVLLHDTLIVEPSSFWFQFFLFLAPGIISHYYLGYAWQSLACSPRGIAVTPSRV